MKYKTLLLFLIILNSCNGQTKSTVGKGLKTINIEAVNLKKTPEKSEGIVYFSSDDGISWENKSDGLPARISVGLGGIATSATLLGIATKENGIYLFDFQKNSWVNIPTDNKIIQSNLGALTFFKNNIYVGTQFGGIFTSGNQGKTWTTNNLGLGNLTIRRFAEIDNRLCVGTNDGFYFYNETLNAWELAYGQQSLQVNGITEFEGNIYIGTNQGIFKRNKKTENWIQILANHSLHNISSDNNTIYAMTYNALLLSSDNGGRTWQSQQSGLPPNLYTFNVLKNKNTVLVGQWDGIYRRDASKSEAWKHSSNGLPNKFAAINLKLYHGIFIISCAERRLKAGTTSEK
jgi:photosystem II stability/assembly factor-like uncharacterized protein